MKYFSSLHFFSIDKDLLEIDYPSYNSTKTTALSPFVEAEFLYKISHTPKKENHTINNFYMNKGVKKGFSQQTLIKKKETQENISLQLDIQSTKPTTSNVTPAEKYIESQLNIIKSVPNEMLQNLEDNLFADDEKEENEKMVNTIGNKTVNGNVSELNLNTTSNVNSFREVYNMNTFSFPKPKPISKNKCISLQMNFRENRFNFIKKIAFGDDKPYLIKHSPSLLSHTIKTHIEPNSHLLTQTSHSYKSGYAKESRQRDKILSFKLMNFYSKNDVDRLLNGRIPLEEKYLKSN